MAIFYDILKAAQVASSTIVPASYIRRKLYRLESDVLPEVIIAPEIPPGEKVAEKSFENGVFYHYPILVAYVSAGPEPVGDGGNAGPLETFLQVREQIRNALFSIQVTGVQSCYQIDLEPDTVLRFAQYVGTDFDMTGWRFTYRSYEQRPEFTV